MARNIRFSLEMEDGAKVQTIEELREHFSIERTLAYIANGKLTTWLRGRYMDAIADEIEALDSSDGDFAEKVCGILQVPYTEDIAKKWLHIKLNRASEIIKASIAHFTAEKSAESKTNIFIIAYGDEEAMYELKDSEYRKIHTGFEKDDQWDLEYQNGMVQIGQDVYMLRRSEYCYEVIKYDTQANNDEFEVVYNLGKRDYLDLLAISEQQIVIRERDCSICVISLDTGTERKFQIPYALSILDKPVVSANGKYIYFIGKDGSDSILIKFDIEKGAVWKLLRCLNGTSMYGFILTDYDEAIVWGNYNREKNPYYLLSVDIQTGEAWEIYSGEEWIKCAAVYGDTIIYVSCHEGVDIGCSNYIKSVSCNGESEPECIAKAEGCSTVLDGLRFAWTEGEYVYFGMRRPEEAMWFLPPVRMRLSDNRLERLEGLKYVTE